MEINVFAIVVSAIASMVLGSLWYSPILFGKAWTKAMGMKNKDHLKEMQKGAGKAYALCFLATIVTAFVMNLIVSYTQVKTAMFGAQIGFWMWLGFVGSIGTGMIIFEKKPVKLYLINMGYQLGSLLIIGAVIAAMA